MDSKIRKEVEERRDKLLKSAAILDEMLKTGDASLYEKEYWDKVVDDFDNPEEKSTFASPNTKPAPYLSNVTLSLPIIIVDPAASESTKSITSPNPIDVSCNKRYWVFI